MAITYGAAAGTHITTHAVAETGVSQALQTGNNTVIVSDSYTNTENGQSGDGTLGIGLSYVGRLVIKNRGAADVEIRRCISETATGTGTLYRLEVHEDWVTNPVSGDTIAFPYEWADVEDGTASGGVAFTTRTGYFTASNDFTIDSDGGFQMLDGVACELDDNSSAATFINSSGGYFYSGYQAGDEYINGGLMLTVNNVTGEPLYDFQAGCKGYLYDMLFWAQLVDSDANHANTGDMEFYGCKWLNGTNELILYDANVTDSKAYGKGATTSIIRVDAGTVVDGLVVSTIHALDSAADTTTETLSNLERITFSNTTNILTVRQNKTWNLIDPNWSVTTYTDLDWNGTATGNVVNDRRAIKVTVKSGGTVQQNALVNVYENTQLDDLVVEQTTDADGYAEDSFIYKAHATNSITTTYGGHALQVGKWLYLPFVTPQTSTSNFIGDISILPDANIVQTTQATAKTAGASVTWNEDTNPSEIFDFTLGSGTLAVGMILTFSPSGATGTITESLDGDSTAGTIHLEARSATAIANGDTFSRTGGTAGTFSGTYTNSTTQPFSIWIDAATISYQALYDYLAAIQNETTLTADGELIWEWCRSAQTQPFYHTGSSHYTERSNSKGIIVVNGGAGTLDYFTDDAGATWIPPTTVTLEITVQDVGQVVIQNAQTSIFLLDSPFTQLMNEDTTALGVASESYSYVGDVDIVYKVRKSDDLDSPRYQPFSGIGQITASGFTATVTLEVNPFL